MKKTDFLAYVVCIVHGIFLGLILSLFFIPKNKQNNYKQRDYQLEIKNTTALLYNDQRLVGTFKLTGELNELIITDNL